MRYAVLIKFPHENKFEDETVINTYIVGIYDGWLIANNREMELREQFAAEVRKTEKSKEYFISIRPIPDGDEMEEWQIQSLIERASYSY
jgi:hypothetical protein